MRRCLAIAALSLGAFGFPAGAAGQPLTPAEAEAAGKKWMGSPELRPGSYRHVNETRDPRGGQRITTLTLRESERVAWTRTEYVRLAPDGSVAGEPEVFINTPEGAWNLIPPRAIFVPKFVAPPPSEAIPAPGAPKRIEPEDVRKYLVWSGERLERDGRKLLHVTCVITKEGIALMKEMASQRMKEMKIPLLVRAAVFAVAGPKFMAEMPARQEWLVDEAGDTLLEHRSFSPAGQLIAEEKAAPGHPLESPEFERVAPWPRELFAPPPGLEQIRAKTYEEGQELVRQYTPRP